MTDEINELDRALAANYRNDPDADIVPSSGFAHAVMDAVRAAKAAPPPIPFPWTRALLSLGTVAVILGVAASGVIPVASPLATDGWSFALPAAVRATIQAVGTPAFVWTSTALLLATASIVGAMRTGEWLHRR